MTIRYDTDIVRVRRHEAKESGPTSSANEEVAKSFFTPARVFGNCRVPRSARTVGPAATTRYANTTRRWYLTHRNYRHSRRARRAGVLQKTSGGQPTTIPEPNSPLSFASMAQWRRAKRDPGSGRSVIIKPVLGRPNGFCGRRSDRRFDRGTTNRSGGAPAKTDGDDPSRLNAISTFSCWGDFSPNDRMRRRRRRRRRDDNGESGKPSRSPESRVVVRRRTRRGGGGGGQSGGKGL